MHHQRRFIQAAPDMAVLDHPRWELCVVIERTPAFMMPLASRPSAPQARVVKRRPSYTSRVRSYHVRLEERHKALPSAAKADLATPRTSIGFHAVFGIYELLSGPYIALIRESDAVLSKSMMSPLLGPEPPEEELVEFRRAASITILPLFRTGRDLSPRMRADEDRYLDYLSSAFRSHAFYFSYRHDVTSSFQRRAFRHARHGKQVRVERWRTADERFFWNREAIEPLIDAGIGDAWVVPVMSAHIEVREGVRVAGVAGRDHAFTYVFVSRRCKLRAGTRFNRRGVSADGHAANEVETETALLHDDGSVQAHVQLRGSIPLLWKSPVTLKYAPTVVLCDDDEANAAAFRQNMLHTAGRYCVHGLTYIGMPIVCDKITPPAPPEEVPASELTPGRLNGSRRGVQPNSRPRKPTLRRKGSPTQDERASLQKLQGTRAPEGWQGDIVCVNLVDRKGTQGRLGEAFQEQVDAAMHTVAGREALPTLQYIWFDFHRECRKMRWHNLSKLLDQVREPLREQGWFYQLGSAGHREIVGIQHGVLRTNCMDNLDRTNVVQAIVARDVLLRCLLERESVQHLGPGARGADALAGAAVERQTPIGAAVAQGTVLDSGIRGLEGMFKEVWANNADALSLLYAGSGALKTDFTRTGKRSTAGRIRDLVNSIRRYYLNNFSDGARQDAIDLMLLNYVPRMERPSPFATKPNHETLDVFLTKVFVVFVLVFVAVLVTCRLRLEKALGLAMITVAGMVGMNAVSVFQRGGRVGRRMVCEPHLVDSESL